jgi:hypothetical protein
MSAIHAMAATIATTIQVGCFTMRQA